MASQQELPELRLRGTRYCLVCGFRAVRENGRCTFCREVRTWSEVNRAFCALVHGERPRAPAVLDGS